MEPKGEGTAPPNPIVIRAGHEPSTEDLHDDQPPTNHLTIKRSNLDV